MQPAVQGYELFYLQDESRNNSEDVESATSESGVIEPDAMDDYVSLPTAMLFAGARCVLSTLWPVHDLSATLASVRFHQLWNAGRGENPGHGKSPAAALSKTLLWLRGKGEGSLRTVEDLKAAVQELLNGIEDEDVRKHREHCKATVEDYAREHAERFPNSPPFENPVHWAAFTVNGLAW